MALSPPASLVPLLRSNDAPLAPQKTLVTEMLRDKQAKLSALGDEIARLEFTLWSLGKKRADLCAEVTQYSSILSPIRRVPSEIIGEIFLYFAPSMAYRARDLSHGVTIHKVELPWKLAHICRRWRSISLSLGQLWPLLDLGPQRSYGQPPLVADSWDEEFTELLPEFADIGESDPIVPLLSQPSREMDWYYGLPRFEEAEDFEIATTLDFIDGYLQRFGNRPLSFRLWPREFSTLR